MERLTKGHANQPVAAVRHQVVSVRKQAISASGKLAYRFEIKDCDKKKRALKEAVLRCSISAICEDFYFRSAEVSGHRDTPGNRPKQQLFKMTYN